jgi:hypothetical protein
MPTCGVDCCANLSAEGFDDYMIDSGLLDFDGRNLSERTARPAKRRRPANIPQTARGVKMQDSAQQCALRENRPKAIILPV